MKFTALAIASLAATAHGFSSKVMPKEKYSGPALYDPFGLYPKDAPERLSGRIQPLEQVEKPNGPVKDPLNLYRDENAVDQKTEMSASLPFLAKPSLLQDLPGSRDFDPFNFAANEDSLQFMRESEIRHARIAMLAAVGWPISELLDRKLAYLFEMKPLLVYQDRVPSVLNGGLGRTPAAFWASVLGVTAAIETFDMMRRNSAEKNGVEYLPGNLGFDPLGLAGKTTEERKYKLSAELFNGRLAMLAITGFALQEFWTGNSVINETPIFFKPLNIAMEQLADAAAAAAGSF
jgi:hypothetical protein